MLKHIIIIALFIISHAFGAESSHGGSWIEDWLYPDTGLFFWAVITFFIVFVILRWKAWGPLMAALDAREQQIKESGDIWMGYNPRTDKVVNMFGEGIIDPTKVTRLALENAASVAGTLLITEAVVSKGKEKKEKAGGPDPSQMLLG